MTKVTIRRRSESPRADGSASLYAVLNIQRDKVRIPLDIAVKAEDWDAAKERVKGRDPGTKDKNLIISNIKARITDILVRSRLTGEVLTKESFLAAYHNPGDSTNFITYCKRHIDELSRAMELSTVKHHQAAINKVEDYNPNLRISDITPDWLRLYVTHLRDFHHNNPGTIAKNISVIRTHYYGAMRAGLAKNNPFEVYKIPKSDPAIIYLTKEEFLRLTDLYQSNTLPDNEQDVLRFFLFMSFTAMHITDARRLQIEQIFDGVLHYRRAKTKTLVEVPVNEPMQKLIDYYKDRRNRGPLFLNLPSDQSINRLIKIVCGRVNINKAVSAKTGRHTFATLYYLLNNGDIGTLSKILGHTQVNTTMIYAHIMRESKVAGVNAFNDFLKR